MCNSIEQIVICDELIGYTKQFMKGLEVNEETLALDVIDQIGPHGDFMGADHTRQHYKEDWYPKLFDRRPYEDWSRAGGKTLRQRARRRRRSRSWRRTRLNRCRRMCSAGLTRSWTRRVRVPSGL